LHVIFTVQRNKSMLVVCWHCHLFRLYASNPYHMLGHVPLDVKSSRYLHMCYLMLGQVSLDVKSSFAHVTLIWSFTCMYPHVLFQLVSTGKDLSTLLTSVLKAHLRQEIRIW